MIDKIMEKAQLVGIIMVLLAFGIEVFAFTLVLQNMGSQAIVTQGARTMENAALAMIAGTGVAMIGASWNWLYSDRKKTAIIGDKPE